MSASHTPGRLTVRGGYSIYADDGKTPVADTCLTNSIPTNDEANARRLVAAWNACEGLHAESLERNEPLGDQLVDALNQRDELLAALKLAHKELTRAKNVMLSETGNGVVDMNVLWKTEKAIQKVEGK
jgi:hypothetical protein